MILKSSEENHQKKNVHWNLHYSLSELSLNIPTLVSFHCPGPPFVPFPLSRSMWSLNGKQLVKAYINN